jgi:hypothetical protein
MPLQHLALALLTAGLVFGQQGTATSDWVEMFDGKSLAGWAETPFPGRGAVTVLDGAIILGRGRMTGIHWTGAFPKSGYEIRFEAARLEGRDFFAGVVFPINDTHCSWINGGWDGTVVGLSNLDGYDASENDSSTNRDFETGRWYHFRLFVTATHIRGTIDGQVVIDVDIRKRQVGLRFDDTDLLKPLGFSSYGTVAGLRNIAYRRL